MSRIIEYLTSHSPVIVVSILALVVVGLAMFVVILALLRGA